MMQLRTFSPRFSVLLASLIVAATARVAAADTITLMWDPNPETEVTGYIVHVGTQSGVYSQHVDVGFQTVFAFPTAVAGQQYCFAVSAYVAGPVEGPRSNEVCGFSNRPPTLANPGAQTGQVSQAATLQLAGVDPDGQAVTYSVSGLPPGMMLQSSTGFIYGALTTSGSFTVTATVSDGVLTASQTFTWTVGATDTSAPTVTITGPTSSATYSTPGTTVALSGTASDSVGVVQVTWVNNRGGSGTATGTTSWSVGSVALQTGANVLTVTARDAAGNTASDVLTVNVNGAPVLTNPGSPSSPVAQATSLQLSAIDPNGDTLTYTATGLPPGFSLTASNGLIAGTPVLTGSYPVMTTVSDGALSASQSFTWTIAPNASGTGTIRLMWDANTDSGIAGYIVHTGIQSGVYLQHYDVGLTTTYVFANAVQGQRYCFTVSAYVAGPVEGPQSAEVCGYSNTAPALASVANQTSNAGQAASLPLAGSDPEGSVLTYSATGLPAGLSVAAASGLISGTPTTAGTFTVTATVSDGTLTASRTFTWTITGDTTAPVISITTPTTAPTYSTGAGTIALGGSASDLVGVTQVSWTNNRGGSGVATGTSTWNAPAVSLASGQNVITVTARDAAGNRATAVLTVTRNAVPTLAAIASQTIEAGRFASLQLVGSDADGDLLTYGAYGLPPGMALVVSTGLLSGTPTEPGVYTVTATVLDGVQSASRTFTWTITADVTAPVIAITAPTTSASYSSSLLEITVGGTASDSLGVAQVSWTNNRGGSGVATGTTNWSTGVTALQSGINVLTVTARDQAGNAATRTLTVTVNTAPVLASVANQTTAFGTWAALQLSASDPDGDALTFSATGLPAGLAIAAGSGLVSGTASAAGMFSVVVTVSDGARSSSQSFTWTVTAVNAAPTLNAVSNQSTRLGIYDTLQLVGADANFDVLTYSATGLPVGMSINAATGLISGTPTTIGTYTVTARVSDGQASRTRTFTWTIKKRLGF